MWPLILLGCTPEDPGDTNVPLPDPEIVAPRFVSCTMSGNGSFQSVGNEWVDYLVRDEEYDAWGNRVFDRTEDEVGGFRQLEATFYGAIQLERTYTDLFVSPVVTESDVWTWSGDRLVERTSVEGGVPSRTTYTSTGDAWNEGAVDVEDDGSIDRVVTAAWQSDRIIETLEDDGGDGSIERSQRNTFDSDGRLTQRERIGPDQTVLLEQTWSDASEGDYLLSSRETVTVEDQIPRVTFRQVTWSSQWDTNETQVFVDGELTEIAFREFDRDGRLTTWLRTFPNGSFASSRELWDWDCP